MCCRLGASASVPHHAVDLRVQDDVLVVVCWEGRYGFGYLLSPLSVLLIDGLGRKLTPAETNTIVHSYSKWQYPS